MDYIYDKGDKRTARSNRISKLKGKIRALCAHSVCVQGFSNLLFNLQSSVLLTIMAITVIQWLDDCVPYIPFRTLIVIICVTIGIHLNLRILSSNTFIVNHYFFSFLEMEIQRDFTKRRNTNRNLVISFSTQHILSDIFIYSIF